MSESKYDTESFDSSGTHHDIEQYNPTSDPEGLDGADQLSRHLSNILSTPQGIEKIESLARVLSTKTKKQLDKFEINKEDFDLQLLLQYLHEKSVQSGIESAQSGLAFKGLTCWGVDASAAFGPSVPEMLRNGLSWPLKFFKKDSTKQRRIIRDFIGIIEPGELVLALGKPGAGCSSLLKSCAGEIENFTKVEGEFSYDGLSQEEMMKHFKGYVVYNPELDCHFPHITVKETVQFALRTKTPRTRIDSLSRSEYVNNMLHLWTTVFGLTHTYSTKVGNDFVRGVSGGERKRVSIVEALSMDASVYCFDNATRGLDASTALEFTQCLRTATNMLGCSALVAIYQAGQNIYELFDKVTVIYKGRQVYFGPAEEGVAYFTRMGFLKPDRMTSPEFLTAVTSPSSRKVRPGYENKVPDSSDEFEEYWLNSPEYKRLLEQYDTYVSTQKADDTRQRLEFASAQRKQSLQRQSSQFVVNYFSQVYYLMIRGFQRTKGDFTYTLVYLSSFLTKGFIVGSMYYHIPSHTNGAYSRGGMIFYCLLFCGLTSLAEIANSFHNRPILVKQKSYSMYHLSAESLQEIITEIPTKLAAVLILCFTAYFMPSLKLEAGPFFMFLLFLFTIQQCMSFIFKLVATVTTDGTTAHAIGGLWIMMLCVYSGFMLPLPQMHHWIKWIHYLNPMFYCYNSLMGSEFHGRVMKCSNMIPSGPGYESVSLVNQICELSGAKMGEAFVTGDDYILRKFDFYWHNVWKYWGINVCYTAGFIAINVFLSEFVKNVESGGDLLLFKRGCMPDASGDEDWDGKVATREEMMTALNGPNADLPAIIAKADVFTWQHLDYIIPYEGAKRQLLCDIQGYVTPGTMTALMGESGAGKTTLLNVLAQRIDFGVITGDMFVNGRPLDSSFKRRTGYVQQQDLHMSEFTVRESLRFAADLRQPKETPRAEKHEYVEKIIGLLGMDKYSDAMVGKIGRGLNVEQRKKLSIATELVAKPTLLLFLDEPTSGLDSESSWSIVQFLRALADSGQAILCTIHQPSATLFEVFDRLLLLKKGGQTVYFGDIGPNSSVLTDYFARHSGVECKKSENPAEYILNCIGAGATASTDKNWNEIWNESPECAEVTRYIDHLHAELPKRPENTSAGDLTATYANSYDKQFLYVLSRTYLQFWRSPVYLRAKFLECVMCALFVGFSYIGMDHTVAGAGGAFSSVFMLLLIALAMINQSHVYAIESRELFEVREALSNTFHWSALLLSHTLLEIFWSTICEFICFICYYWPAQYSGTAHHAGYFFFIYVLIFPIYFMTYGLAVLYFSPDVPSASMINSNLFASMLLFCGILNPEQFSPHFWSFMYTASPFKYFVQAFVAPLLHDRKLECAFSEYSIMNPPDNQTCGQFLDRYVADNGGYIANPEEDTQCKYCPYTTQIEVVAQYGIKWDQHWRNFGIVWIYIIFNFFAMLGGYWLFRVKKFSISDMFNVTKWFKKSGPKQRHEKDTTIFKAQKGDAQILVPKKQG
ncbi:hypothetical protein CANARDRAFT_5996 [[Candida] arabinofermentans NRRL YB-2248]|uniref:ABC transporter domain-containing protein n=1 Tax=[Candida] arabinofermentans NRRL YB-2248 TaxID=983967 RepID=A0A1E4T6X3_9ASCO|nr:hypothetical protein CANARDRAFT_5996 [[Candida] arabinofermentans NRRL YB-2248]